MEPWDPLFARCWLPVEEHFGTYGDALAHMTLDDAGTLCGLPLEAVPLFDPAGRPRVVDYRSLRGGTPGESPWIKPEEVLAYETATGLMERQDVVLFWTRWSDAFHQGSPEGDS
jgi:kynurenine formamidase